MTAPVIASYSQGGTTSGTTFDVSVPDGGASSGDLLILVCGIDGASTGSSSGFTTLDNSTEGGAGLWTAYRICTGSEGTTIGCSTSSTDDVAWICYKIAAANWHGTSPPEVGTANTGNDSSPNPPSLTASWGNEDCLFIAGMGSDDGRDTCTAGPSGYSNFHAQNQGAVAGCNGAAATLATTADGTEDPGVFTLSSGEQWTAQTIVVRPAGSGTVPAARTETSSATTTQTATRDRVAARSESSNATTTQDAAAARVAARTETANATDSQTGLRVKLCSAEESSAASATQASALAAQAVREETSDATATASATAARVAARDESAAASASEAAVLSATAAAAESSAASSTQDGIRAKLAAAEESSSAASVQGATWAGQAGIEESAAAAGTGAATGAFQAAASESATSGESSAAALGTSADITEGAISADSESASLGTVNASAEESSAAASEQDAAASFASGITESAGAASSAAAALGAVGAIAELAYALDVSASNAVFPMSSVASAIATAVERGSLPSEVSEVTETSIALSEQAAWIHTRAIVNEQVNAAGLHYGNKKSSSGGYEMSHERNLSRIAMAGATVRPLAQDVRDMIIYGAGPPDVVMTCGGVSIGDFGGGDYFWDDTSVDDDDTGMVIAVEGVETGRYRRVLRGGRLDAAAFGVVGDGVTDDSDALIAWAKALNTYNVPGVLRRTESYYRTTKTIKIYDGTDIDSNGALIWNQNTGGYGATDTHTLGLGNNHVSYWDHYLPTFKNISATTSNGQRTVTLDSVGDAASFPAGTTVIVKGEDPNGMLYWSYNQVESVSGANLTLRFGLLEVVSDQPGNSTNYGGSLPIDHASQICDANAGIAQDNLGDPLYCCSDVRIHGLSCRSDNGVPFDRSATLGCDLLFNELWGYGALFGNSYNWTRLGVRKAIVDRKLLDTAGHSCASHFIIGGAVFDDVGRAYTPPATPSVSLIGLGEKVMDCRYDIGPIVLDNWPSSGVSILELYGGARRNKINIESVACGSQFAFALYIRGNSGLVEDNDISFGRVRMGTLTRFVSIDAVAGIDTVRRNRLLSGYFTGNPTSNSVYLSGRANEIADKTKFLASITSFRKVVLGDSTTTQECVFKGDIEDLVLSAAHSHTNVISMAGKQARLTRTTRRMVDAPTTYTDTSPVVVLTTDTIAANSLHYTDASHQYGDTIRIEFYCRISGTNDAKQIRLVEVQDPDGTPVTTARKTWSFLAAHTGAFHLQAEIIPTGVNTYALVTRVMHTSGATILAAEQANVTLGSNWDVLATEFLVDVDVDNAADSIVVYKRRIELVKPYAA